MINTFFKIKQDKTDELKQQRDNNNIVIKYNDITTQ